MKTPGELLAAVLAQRNVAKLELAQRITAAGLGKSHYLQIHRWTKNDGFHEGNQLRAAVALGLPIDAFMVRRPGAPPLDVPTSAPRATQRRKPGEAAAEKAAARVYRDFTARSPIAEALTAGEHALLRSIRWYESGRVPSVAFFESVAYSLRGLLPMSELSASADENEALDRTLRHKPPLKRR